MSLNNYDRIILNDILPNYDKGAGKIVGVGTIGGERRVVLQNFSNELRYINGRNEILNIESDQIVDFARVELSDVQQLATHRNPTLNPTSIFNKPAQITNNFLDVNNLNTEFRTNIDQVPMVVIALFLGWLGVHLFLMGRIWWGILYVLLAFTGISSILGLIDAIKMGVISKEEYRRKYNYVGN